MKRRAYLTAIGATSAALLSGCSALSGSTGDTNNGTSDSTQSPSDTPTPTPEPSPIENIAYEGKSIKITLRSNSQPQLVEFLNPNGERIDRQTVNSATQISFPLVDTTVRDPCASVYDPGEYTIAVDFQSGQTYRKSVTLEPDLSISGLSVPSSMGVSLEEFQSGETQYRGGLVIEFTNDGSLPACVTRTQVLGEEIPTPRTGKETSSGDGRSELFGGSGAGLNWYASEAPKNHVPEQVVVWIGTQRYLTTYIPFVVPQSRYESQAFENGPKSKVREKYVGKKLSGVVTATTSNGRRLALPFRLLLSGEVMPISQLFGVNVYMFSNAQIAFDPQAAVEVGNTSTNVSSLANSPSGTVTFPENATNATNATNGTSRNATGSGATTIGSATDSTTNSTPDDSSA